MLIIAILRDYGWTYQEYLEQPVHHIELIKERMRIDAKAQEMQIKKMKRG